MPPIEQSDVEDLSQVLSIQNLTKTFDIGRGSKNKTYALDRINFGVEKGKTLAVVGESGSGKSTMAKLIMKLQTPSDGEIRIRIDSDHVNIAELQAKDLYRKIQMVFQDPYASLNPRKRVWSIVSAPLCNYVRLSSAERKELALKYLLKVGLGEMHLDSFPHMLSGGQRQRVSIARALVTDPEILILDEPLSALDLSIQAQIINLLLELQKSLGLTFLFISHDIVVARHIADTVLVLKSGRLIESGLACEVLENPKQEYTKNLLISVPPIRVLDRGRDE